MAADKRPAQHLNFPAPSGFGEPVAYLVVAVNDRGEPCFHATGDATQTLFLSSQALNWAISRAVVIGVERGQAQLAVDATWAQGPGGHG